MVKTVSTMLPLGTAAPPFSLVNVDGKTMSLDDYLKLAEKKLGTGPIKILLSELVA